MSEIIIKTNNLTKQYETEGIKVTVSRKLNLEIIKGEFAVIMGSSGSGKSTLLYLLSGLEKVSDGEVWFRNERIDNISERDLAVIRRKGMGFVFQNINLVSNLSIYENILVSAYLVEKDRKKANKKAKELLQKLNIDNLSERLPSQLSGGEQQRGAILRALVNSPEVLFADEPTGALNFATGQVILDHFNEINNEGQTIVMVTHDVKAASRGSRVLFMRDGNIEGDFTFDKKKSLTWDEKEKILIEFLSEKGW